jgi:basic amino acid/polyamine antiporter, APA family
MSLLVDQMNNNKLKRSLSLPLITFFGLGNIMGAGIYVLVGKVAGEAGYFAPLAFFIASVIAAISAFTYAELSARYPVSAGEAVYLNEGLNIRALTIGVGLLITIAGMVSTSALAHGFAGYLSVFVDLPNWLIIASVILLLGGLAIWGIGVSVMLAAIFTVIELIGLVIIVVLGGDYIATTDLQLADNTFSLSAISWAGVFSAAFLAFYAYLGFEDMVNVAEEVKEPEKNMPRAIIIALLVSTLLYSLVSIVAVLVIEPQQLSASNAPLADVYQKITNQKPVLLSVIGLFAVINGALIQIIMASRLLYGMSKNGWLPKFLSAVNPTTNTPIVSTILVVAIILILSLVFQLVTLATITSYIVLSVFALVNLSLIKIKSKNPHPENIRVYSTWVPVTGFLTTVLFIVIEISNQLF